MATKKSGGIGKDQKKNLFFRSLGWVFEAGKYKQPKFYLGRDGQEAERRNLRLEQLWRCVTEQWKSQRPRSRVSMATALVLGKKGERPAWTSLLLGAGKALSRGEDAFPVPLPEGMAEHEYFKLIARLNREFPVIRFTPADAQAFEVGEEVQTEFYQGTIHHSQRLAEDFDEPVATAPHERLHHALDAYIADLEKNADVSQWNRVRVNQARRLRDHYDDIALAALDVQKVEAMIDYWRNRPPVKLRGSEGVGGAMAYNTCRNQIIQLRHFFKWLHRHPDYSWKRPDGYEDIKATPITTAADKSNKLRTIHIETYTPEELAVLYAAASPLMRLFILLGLNCGFAAAEAGTLELAEIFLHQKHPEDGRYGITSTEADSWIRRLRHKTEVYGEWKLWPHTVLGLQWAMRRRRQIESKEKALIVTSTGQSYGRATKGGNKNSRVRNLWVSLINKTVKPQHEGFRFLPFKQLRKTGGQLVRQFADGETQGLFLCHGKPVKGDQLADIYSNRPFHRVFAVLDKIEQHLAPMWQAVPDPFGNAG